MKFSYMLPAVMHNNAHDAIMVHLRLFSFLWQTSLLTFAEQANHLVLAERTDPGAFTNHITPYTPYSFMLFACVMTTR